MTINELRDLFNREYGIERKWPPTYEVDHITYANVCQGLFDHLIDTYNFRSIDDYFLLEISAGPNHGIMFKGVELILAKNHTEF